MLLLLLLQGHTGSPIAELGRRLAEEVEGLLAPHAASRGSPLRRLSFVAHSLGGLIVRAAVADPALAPFRAMLHLFLSLAGPHTGLLHSPSWLARAAVHTLARLPRLLGERQQLGGDPCWPPEPGQGICLHCDLERKQHPGVHVESCACVQLLSQLLAEANQCFPPSGPSAASVRELALADGAAAKDCYLAKLAAAYEEGTGLGLFSHVVLVASPQDALVPRASALALPCARAEWSTARAAAHQVGRAAPPEGCCRHLSLTACAGAHAVCGCPRVSAAPCRGAGVEAGVGHAATLWLQAPYGAPGPWHDDAVLPLVRPLPSRRLLLHTCRRTWVSWGWAGCYGLT
jgi:hypothetical protein